MTPADLLKRRKNLSLTQTQLAEYLGVTPNTVARWERGELGIRRPRMLDTALSFLEKQFDK